MEKLYWYAYQHYKQKHVVIEKFDTDEDFVIEDEGFALETSPLGAGRVSKKVRLVATDGDMTRK